MKRFLIALAAGTIAMPGWAHAHVEVKPQRAPAGSQARLTLEVENERPTSGTRRIDLQVPAGVTSLEGRALRGWKLRLRPASGNPRRAVLTAPAGKEITGHEVTRFGLAVGLPPRPGERITFKVLQTYDNGEVVRWIGPPGTSEPAPTLRLTAAEQAPEEPAPAPESRPPTETGAAAENTSGDDGGDSSVVPVAAGVGALVVAGLAVGLVARRRSRRDPTG